MPKGPNPLLILASKLGYQTRSFVEAAQMLGLDAVFATDRCHQLEDPWGDGAIAVHFEDPEAAAQRVLESGHRFRAVIALGDRPTPAAARIVAALGLPGHTPAAADACRDKYAARAILARAGLRVPRFKRFALDHPSAPKPGAPGTPVATPPAAVARRIAETVGYPCVLKPLALSGSRGVIRANTPGEAAAAFERIAALLRSPEIGALREDTSEFIQAESYVAGAEVAVEALVERGAPRILALFDKPDPLAGPYFEETLYVTPSRLPVEQQRAVIETLRAAVEALGLSHGPVHAEFRINAGGVWPLEVAARSIGGLCSRALRFTRPGAAYWMSLEEVVIRLALGEPTKDVAREPLAAGVMMIPIPRAGIYHGVEGVDEALSLPGVDEVRITAKPEQKLAPLPEGGSYLGFIFARAPRPEQVETALRAAHSRLRFTIGAELPVLR